MNNNQLMEVKNNIFTKIKNFFKKIFTEKKQLPDEITKNSAENKREFFEQYNKIKKGEIDIFSIDPDEVEKMCIILEEENKIQEQQLSAKLNQLAEINKKLEEVKSSL